MEANMIKHKEELEKEINEKLLAKEEEAKEANDSK